MKLSESKFEIVILTADFSPGWTDKVIETAKILPSKLKGLDIDGNIIDFNDPEHDVMFRILPNYTNSWPENEIHVRVTVRTQNQDE